MIDFLKNDERSNKMNVYNFPKGNRLGREIKFYYLSFKFGCFFLCKLDGKLVWAEFEKKNSKPLLDLVKMGYALKEDEYSLREEILILERYFKGEKIDFDKIPISFIIGTDNEKKVWRELSKIPYGRTVTYSYIAEKIGMPYAQRFVGNAVGRNPIPIIIPCHRVVRKDGTLGGFSAGLHVKRYLLELESALNK